MGRGRWANHLLLVFLERRGLLHPLRLQRLVRVISTRNISMREAAENSGQRLLADLAVLAARHAIRRLRARCARARSAVVVLRGALLVRKRLLLRHARRIVLVRLLHPTTKVSLARSGCYRWARTSCTAKGVETRCGACCL